MAKYLRYFSVIYFIFSMSVLAQTNQLRLTDQEINAAINLGKSRAKLEPYRIGRGGRWWSLKEKAFILTPFLRIAFAARSATKAHKSFSESDISEEMLDSLLWVVVPAFDRGPYWSLDTERFVDASTVVIVPKGSRGVDKAIQPTWTKENISTLMNVYGAKYATQGLIAAFPREVFKQGYELVLVYVENLAVNRRGKEEFRDELKREDIIKFR